MNGEYEAEDVGRGFGLARAGDEAGAVVGQPRQLVRHVGTVAIAREVIYHTVLLFARRFLQHESYELVECNEAHLLGPFLHE